MTTQALIAAAIANRGKRLAQVAALRPLVKGANQRADELQAARKGVKETGQRAGFVRSMHHVPGFFPTPPAVVARMIEAADLVPGLCCLEPEAGTANIARAIVAAGCSVSCVEIVQGLADKLRADGFTVQCRDFLTMEAGPLFDRVLMNPPFEKRQDEDHVRHAFGMLKPGGRLVAVVSSMSALRLADWVRGRGRIEPLPVDSFRSSERPTGVNTSLVIINR